MQNNPACRMCGEIVSPHIHIQIPDLCALCCLECETWVINKLRTRFGLRGVMRRDKIPCAVCDTTFVRFNIMQKYCSIQCKSKASMTAYKAREKQLKQISVKCVVCDITFQTNKKHATTCSLECRVIHIKRKQSAYAQLQKERRWEHYTRPLCVVCSQPFLRLKGGRQVVCSDVCRAIHYKEQNNKRGRERRNRT